MTIEERGPELKKHLDAIKKERRNWRGVVSVWVGLDVKWQLRMCASAANMSLSQFCRDVLEAAIRRRKREIVAKLEQIEWTPEKMRERDVKSEQWKKGHYSRVEKQEE